jgi:cytidyltransferase-like protein
MITGVWLGRFQPVHNGHLDFLRAAGEQCDQIFVFAVGSSRKGGDSIHADVMDKSHEMTRNPFNLADRFRWLTSAIGELGPLRRRVYCSMGPRIDYDPDFYRMALPPERVFLVSDRDADEDRKRILLEMAGETCITIRKNEWSQTSSTQVRNALLDNDHFTLRKMLPKCLWKDFIESDADARSL